MKVAVYETNDVDFGILFPQINESISLNKLAKLKSLQEE